MNVAETQGENGLISGTTTRLERYIRYIITHPTILRSETTNPNDHQGDCNFGVCIYIYIFIDGIYNIWYIVSYIYIYIFI